MDMDIPDKIACLEYHVGRLQRWSWIWQEVYSDLGHVYPRVGIPLAVLGVLSLTWYAATYEDILAWVGVVSLAIVFCIVLHNDRHRISKQSGGRFTPKTYRLEPRAYGTKRGPFESNKQLQRRGPFA